MMTRKQWFRLGVVVSGLVASMLLGGCAQLQAALGTGNRPSAELRGMSLDKITLQSTTVWIDLEVKNPYTVPLPLVNLDYTFSHADKTFLSGQADLQGTVPAQSSKTLRLPAEVSYAGVLAAVKSVRPGAVVPFAAEVGLSVDAPGLGKIRLPLSRKSELPIPAAPGVKIAGIRWDKIGLREANGTVSIELTNHNQFDVDLDSMKCAMKLADRDVGDVSLKDAAKFPPGESRTVSVGLKVSTAQLGASLLSIVRGSEAKYSLDGDTTLGTRFGKMVLPLSGAGKTPLKR